MVDDRYKFAEEKFSKARRSLMFPPRGKEAVVISEACADCGVGLADLPLEDLEHTARDRVSNLLKLIERKDKLSEADKPELCDLINYLAFYFHDRWTGVWG
jgi:hypothetical protein